MSRHLLFFILLFLSACKTGFRKTIEKYPSGKVKVEYIYPDKDDTTKFTYIAYYENGQKLFKCEAIDMKFIGQKINYYDNGRIQTTEKLVRPTTFEDMLYDCEITEYNRKGQLEDWYAYKNGSINCVAREYDTLGNLSRKVDWVNGKKNGKLVNFYPSGKVKSFVYFRNDTAVNFTYLFDEKGDTLKYTFHNISGDFALPYKKWLDNGLTLTGNYTNRAHTKALWQWFDKTNNEVKRKRTSETKDGLVAPE